MIGIYKITNKINNKCYIGQSVDIYRRWNDEKRAAFNSTDRSYNYPLSCAFRKYGLEQFTFEIIEECSKSELNNKEIYWIDFYNSFYEGYNQTLGGEGSASIPKEKILGVINDLKTTDLYHKEIAEKWHISIETVQGINTGRYWFSEYENYPLQTQHKGQSRRGTQPKVWKCIDCGSIISKGSTRCAKCYAKTSRKVSRPSKDELYNYLKQIKGNFSQAGRTYGVSDNAIRKWCKAYNIPSKSQEYKNI